MLRPVATILPDENTKLFWLHFAGRKTSFHIHAYRNYQNTFTIIVRQHSMNGRFIGGRNVQFFDNDFIKNVAVGLVNNLYKNEIFD